MSRSPFPLNTPPRKAYEGPSEASPESGGVVTFAQERRLIRRPERSEPGGSGGFPPRKEDSYEGPSEVSPVRKKRHTKAEEDIRKDKDFLDC
jgi:hypothetical protein